MNDVMTSNAYLSRCEDNSFLFNERAWQARKLHDFLKRGFPTRQEERWKYTDTRFLAKQDFAWSTSESQNFSLNKDSKNYSNLSFIYY